MQRISIVGAPLAGRQVIVGNVQVRKAVICDVLIMVLMVVEETLGNGMGTCGASR